jgi:hypothetical protein
MTPPEMRDQGSKYQESRLLLELGQVNLAEADAHDALESCGDLPAVLEQLAIIYIVKGQPDPARVFLHALAQHPLQAGLARGMLKRLAADPRLEDDPRVSRIRRNMLLKDNFLSASGAEQILEPLLERNPQNMLAFHLLMARYLSALRPDKVLAGLQRQEGLEPARLPRRYQEAVLVAAGIPGGERYGVAPDVIERARQFRRILGKAGSQEDAATAALNAGFGDSYFFYYAFGRLQP